MLLPTGNIVGLSCDIFVLREQLNSDLDDEEDYVRVWQLGRVKPRRGSRHLIYPQTDFIREMIAPRSLPIVEISTYLSPLYFNIECISGEASYEAFETAEWTLHYIEALVYAIDFGGYQMNPSQLLYRNIYSAW